MNIVLPALVVIGTCLFAWGAIIANSGLLIAGVVFLAVAILFLKFGI